MIYRYDYCGSDSATGMAIWSCTRDGAGICGYGSTHKDALQAFLDVEQELTPTSSYLTGFTPFDAPERFPVPTFRDEE